MSAGSVWVDCAPDDEDAVFQNAALFELGHFVGEIILGIIPDARIDIVAEQDRSGMTLGIKFEKEENIALFIGPKFRVVNAILEVIRFQQLVKHDRYIVFEIHKQDGSSQRVSNKRTFAGNPNIAEGVQAKLNRVLNIRSERAQLNSLSKVVDYIKAKGV